mmetsp:Transcript_13085/g.46555  ORF Transcript_13085/g.46555 Transcript_13085/m.46555 type:complete len:114 (+) Transcript_13085:1593-1934(+)
MPLCSVSSMYPEKGNSFLKMSRQTLFSKSSFEGCCGFLGLPREDPITTIPLVRLIMFVAPLAVPQDDPPDGLSLEGPLDGENPPAPTLQPALRREPPVLEPPPSACLPAFPAI